MGASNDMLALVLLLSQGLKPVLITTTNGINSAQGSAAQIRGLLSSLGLADVPVVSGGMEDLGPVRNIDPGAEGEYRAFAQFLEGLHKNLMSLPWITVEASELEKKRLNQVSAAQALLETTTASKPVILATGPLTNLAHAERIRPGWLAEQLKLVVMGGAFRRSGDGPGGTEWNFHLAARAAHEVIAAAPKDTLLVTNDVANKEVCTKDESKALISNATSSPFGTACKALLNIDLGAPRYDPVAAACVAMPGIVTAEDVVLNTDALTGVITETSADSSDGRHVRVATQLDRQAYHRLLQECAQRS